MVRFKRASLVGLLCVPAVGWLTACKSSTPPATPVTTVPVTTVATATLANDLTLTAEFQPYQDVDVMAKVAGYVKTISVDIGDRVQQGQVLAVLEAPEIQSDVARANAGVAAAQANIVTAQAAVERARATANMAKLSFQRLQDVATKEKGLVPRQDIDVAQSREMEAEAQLASAESSVQAATEAKAGADQEYGLCDDSCALRRCGDEALCQHGLDDSGGYLIADAGDACGETRSEQPVASDPSRSGERCSRGSRWSAGGRKYHKYGPHFAGHRHSLGGFRADRNADDGHRG
jgi:multidrug efflux pump subunit AcrA (membrane-fusion protein)